MSAESNSTDLDELLHRLSEETISDGDWEQLCELLRNDPAARKAYLESTTLTGQLHYALEDLSFARKPGDTGSSARALLEALLETRAAEETRPALARTNLYLITAAGWVAACIAIAFILFSTSKLGVTVAAVDSADWRGLSFEAGDRLTSHMLDLRNGAVELDFPTNTRVVIQAPAFFQVIGNDTLQVAKGAVTVTHNGKPGSFALVTPTGTLKDLGTQFGVSVGSGKSDSFVLTEVFEGKVAFENHADGEDEILEDGQFVEIRGRNQTSASTLRRLEGRFLVPHSDLQQNHSPPSGRRNLALNKPVQCSRYWIAPSVGEVFPPTNINDGRLNDSGVPGDWSFWKLPHESTGWIMIDLEQPELISSIAVQNIRNRWYFDRATEGFRIEVSLDGKTFTPIVEGTLKTFLNRKERLIEFPLETFDFEPVKAQYVKFHVLSYAKSGAGLNEIRIFE